MATGNFDTLAVPMKLAVARRVLVWFAGIALLLAMAVDSLAMVGRQIEVPLLGAIEIVQAAVLFSASGALLIATLDETHARVNLLLERLSPDWRARLETFHLLAAAVLLAGLLAGSVWISADLWSGHEESELLRIPYRPLRVAVNLALGGLLLIVLRRLIRRRSG